MPSTSIPGSADAGPFLAKDDCVFLNKSEAADTFSESSVFVEGIKFGMITIDNPPPNIVA